MKERLGVRSNNNKQKINLENNEEKNSFSKLHEVMIKLRNFLMQPDIMLCPARTQEQVGVLASIYTVRVPLSLQTVTVKLHSMGNSDTVLFAIW